MGKTTAASLRNAAQLLLQIQAALDSDGHFDQQLQIVLELVTEALDAEAAVLCVPDRASDRGLSVAFARRGCGVRRALLDVELGLRKSVLSTGAPLRLEDAVAEPHFNDNLEGAFGMQPRSLLAVPLRLSRSPIGLLVAARERVRAFDDSDEELLLAVADKLAFAVENDRLLGQLRLELEERRLLLEVSRKVGQTLDLDIVLDQVFRALQPVVGFDAGAIFLVRCDGSLALSAQHGYADETPLLRVPEGTGIVGIAKRSGHGVRLDDVREAPDYLDVRASTRSEMAVPIRGGGATIGVVNLESDRPSAFSERDQRIAELIAAQVSSAIVNARLHRDRLERSRIQHELELAREIQRGQFPKAAPDHPAIEIAAVNVPSSAVGGDYYDYLLVGDDELWLALADVSGHGLSASLLTGVTQTGFRLLAQEQRDPARLAARLNKVLYDGTPPSQYAAAVLSILDLRTGQLRYCNAGHLPPAVRQNDTWIELSGGGFPLGMFPDAKYESRSVQLSPGALLVLYTDGVPEALSPDGEEFGSRRLLDLIAADPSRPIESFAPAVRDALRQHRGRRGGYLDDVTLMTARWRGPGAGSPPVGA